MDDLHFWPSGDHARVYLVISKRFFTNFPPSFGKVIQFKSSTIVQVDLELTINYSLFVCIFPSSFFCDLIKTPSTFSTHQDQDLFTAESKDEETMIRFRRPNHPVIATEPPKKPSGNTAGWKIPPNLKIYVLLKQVHFHWAMLVYGFWYIDPTQNWKHICQCDIFWGGKDKKRFERSFFWVGILSNVDHVC